MPPRSPYPGTNKVTVKLKNGERVTYWYAWKGGPRLPGEYGSTEFTRAFLEAVEARSAPILKGTLSDLTIAYQKSRGKTGGGKGYLDLAHRTQLDYAKQIAVIDAKWGTLPIKALSSSKVRGLLLDWRDGLAATSERQADYAITVLARVFSWAKDRGRIPINPLERPGRVYGGTRAEIIWTSADEAAFMKHASEPLRLAFNLALWTGQRPGDLLRLQWSAYDGSSLRFTQSKTGRRMTIPVAMPLRKVLDAAPRRNLTILTNTAGERWTADGFRSSWRKVATRAGVQGPASGDLRGTAVTRLALSGCTVPEIASITGHSNADVSSILDQHYLASDPAIAESGWGTWIRTRTNGVRVRGSTVNLFPSRDAAHSGAGRGRQGGSSLKTSTRR